MCQHRGGATTRAEEHVMKLQDVADLRGRSLLKEIDLTRDEFLYLVELGGQVRQEKWQGVRRDRLGGRNIALLFEKTSTRTPCAFDVAAHHQSAHVTSLGPLESPLGHQEAISDTARVPRRMV